MNDDRTVAQDVPEQAWDLLMSMPMRDLLDRNELPPSRVPHPQAATVEASTVSPRWGLARVFAGAAGTHWPSVISSAAAARQVALGFMLIMSTVVTGVAAAASIRLTGAGTLTLSVVGGAVVAVAAFVTDRTLLTMPSRRGSVRLLHALPRLVFATLLAAVVSGALSVALFRSEIDREIALTRFETARAAEQQIYDDVDRDPRTELWDETSEAAAIDRDLLATREAELQDRQRDLLVQLSQAEMEANSVFVGELMAQLNDVQVELADLRLQRAEVEDALAGSMEEASAVRETQLVDLDMRVEAVRSSIEDGPVGVIERVEVLNDLDSSAVRITQLLILVVAMSLGSLPALMRLQPLSSHDLLLIERERLAAAAIQEREEIRAEMDRQLAAIELFAQQSDRLAEMDVTASQRRHLLERLDEAIGRPRDDRSHP